MYKLGLFFRHGFIVATVLSCAISSVGQGVKSGKNGSLVHSTPEAEGVSSVEILKFLDAVEKGRNEVHSFVILRHGKLVSEGWWNPYAKDLKHVMFSVSKSFTSMGVGIAISEKKLGLSDKVVSFFPEVRQDSMSAFMKTMTVEDLLKMSAGMDTDPIAKARTSNNWPKAFLTSSVEHQPGSVFKYNNMATFMLSVIVQKATGEKLLDYLKPRLFDPLEFKNVTWDETPGGYTFGAIGLRLLSEDMAKFGQMLLQKGKWNGKQIVPQAWVEQATSFKIASDDPSNKTPAELNDWKQGYGYQFWMCRNNGYRADGLGGQFIIVLPEKDAVIVLTCSATNTQEVLDMVWDNLLPAIHDKPLAQNKNAASELSRRSSLLSVKIPATQGSGEWLTKISGKKIQFPENESGIRTITFSPKGNDLTLQIGRGQNETYEFTAGMNKWIIADTRLPSLAAGPRPNQSIPVKVVSRYAWTDSSTVEFASKFLEESIGTDTWTIQFADNGGETTVHIEIKGMRPRVLDGKVMN